MNIPEKILQAVADEAFKALNIIYLASDPINGECQADYRRAVIQHALDNPALAPFLAGGIGEYTDQAIYDAWEKAVEDKDAFPDRVRAFLAALPRRESPSLAEALEEAGNRQAALLAAATWIDELKAQKDRWYEKAKRENELYLKEVEKYAQAIARAEKAEADAAVNYGMLLAARERAEKAEAELSAQLGILRPIAEMPKTMPEGCMAVFRWRDDFGSWVTGTCEPTNGFFAILRLPDAEATPPPACAINHTEETIQHRDAAGYCQICGADWPEPAAQVPLGPEDVPPGSIVTNSADSWYKVKYVTAGGIRIDIQGSNLIDYEELKTDGWSINTSIPDTGRWDENAWRACSKPAGKEVGK